MSTLVTISSSEAMKHRIQKLPIVVLSPQNQCNCKCVMCDIWRIRESKELLESDVERLCAWFREFGVRWVVLSGGEPQLHSHFSSVAKMLRSHEIRVTLLTAGLLLRQEAEMVAANVDNIIISLDGPAAVHDRIRRVKGAFAEIANGIRALRESRPEIVISARCTVQKENHHSICATVEAARQAGFQSLSFLAADLTSTAFNRLTVWPTERQEKVALNPEEVAVLETEVERLINDYGHELGTGFVVETPAKLRRIVHHFRAHLGQAEHLSPRCNAPWVSAVIEATGDVRPCFFHPAFGNIHYQTLEEILNGPEALRFRTELDVESNPICRQCVCSLHLRDTGGEDSPRTTQEAFSATLLR